LQYISTNLRVALAAAQIPPVPLTLFAKGANFALATLASETGYDVLGLDWCIEPSEARKLVGPEITLQGNLDPNVLYGGRKAIEREVKRMCRSFKGGKGPKAWIANLGHGITPGVDPEDLRFFFECVHRYSTAT
jgi:uroporphyrinogen decarboxylase